MSGVLCHAYSGKPVPSVKADVVYEWPTQALRAAASTVVFIGDTFPVGRLPNPQQNLADLGVMMQRGCGIVCVHYATGLLGEDVTPEGDHLHVVVDFTGTFPEGQIGGYFDITFTGDKISFMQADLL